MNKIGNIFDKVKVFKIFSTTYQSCSKRFGLRMNLIIEMIGFKIIKTHIIRYKKLDIMHFILKIFLNFPLKLSSSPVSF